MSTRYAGALEAFFETLETVDPVAATEQVLELLDEGTPVADIAAHVLVPAQHRVGELWERGEWTVADEHAATSVTETAVSALTGSGSGTRATGVHVVVACAEGEWHSLPARTAAAVVASAGRRVTLLVPSLPAEHLATRLRTGDVDLLALSCTVPSNLLGAARCIAAAHDAGVPVVVGGRAFAGRPQRAEALGADAWSDDPAVLTGELPVLSGRAVDVPKEVLLLDSPDAQEVELAHQRVVAAYPRLSGMTPWQQDRTREDLQWMSRFAGAAVLTGDASIVDDLLHWLVRLLRGRVAADVVSTGARCVADVVEPSAPRGAQVLRDAADRLEGSPR